MSLKTSTIALMTALFLAVPAGASPTSFDSFYELQKYAKDNGLILVMGNHSAFTLLTPAEFEAAKAQASRVKEAAGYVRLFGYVVAGRVTVKDAGSSSGGGSEGGGDVAGDSGVGAEGGGSGPNIGDVDPNTGGIWDGEKWV